MFKRILVPLDRSTHAEQALGRAASLARAANAAVDLVLVHHPPHFSDFDESRDERRWNDDHNYLERVATEVASGARIEVSHVVATGDPVDEICRRAWAIDADLVIMTSHGRTGVSRVWIGSVADGVLRHAAVPVLMVRPVERKARRASARRAFRRILVPLDDSALGAQILPSALDLARASDARLVLLHVVHPEPGISLGAGIPYTNAGDLTDDPATARSVEEGTRKLADAARILRDAGVRDVEASVVVDPHVATAIVDFAKANAVDVIAMSTHARGATRLVFGSVAEKVLRAGGLPMLFHRPVGVTTSGYGSSPADPHLDLSAGRNQRVSATTRTGHSAP